MKDLWRDPKKRKQLLIAGAVLAGGIVLYLLLKGKTKTTEGEPTTEPLNLPSEREREGSGSSGGGAGGSEAQGIENAITTAEAQQAGENQALESGLAGLTSALSGYTNALGTQTNGQAAEGANAGPGQKSTPLAKANSLINSQSGNPREGKAYTVGTYEGKPAHIYAEKVKNGVGPHGNVVVLAPAGKSAGAGASKNTAAGNPREGQTFKTVKIAGKTVHEYSHAVKGGVGPKKNRIYV